MVVHIMSTTQISPDKLDTIEQNIKPVEVIKYQRTFIFYDNTFVKIGIAICFTLIVVFIVNISTISFSL